MWISYSKIDELASTTEDLQRSVNNSKKVKRLEGLLHYIINSVLPTHRGAMVFVDRPEFIELRVHNFPALKSVWVAN